MRGLISTLAVVALIALPSRATATPITFEGLGQDPQLVDITNQYAGVTFTNAAVLTTDDSPADNGYNACNEHIGDLASDVFPPNSNCNVITASGGLLRIDFASPFSSVGAYFTYNAPLTVEAFDDSHGSLGTATSQFSENFLGSGHTPNEFMSLSFAGIRSLVLTPGVLVDPDTGEELAGSFTLDDLTFPLADTQPPDGTPVPEPGTVFLVGLAGVRLLTKRSRRS